MQTNPHKWKKYSLDDADISDRTNASAAFAFLAEMERRKDSDDNQDEGTMDTDANDLPCDKILFKNQNNRSKECQKPSFNRSVTVRKQIECTDTKSNESETSEKPMLKGSKVIMPEYVIGQKMASNKTKKNKSCTSSEAQGSDTKQGKQQNQKPLLQHLFDDEDEDQDQDDDDNEMDDN